MNDISSGLLVILKSIDQIVDELNQQGAVKFSVADHNATKVILDKAEKIQNFRGKISILYKEWEQISKISIPNNKDNRNNNDKKSSKQESTSVERKLRTRAKSGQRTKQSQYRLPILMALDSLGGSALVSAVLDRVFLLIGDELNDFDMENMPSDPKRQFWQNYAQWERLSMVNDGLLKRNSPKGIWELTEAGWVALGKEAKYHQAIIK